MSPQSGQVLLEEIAPRLKAVVPYIKTVGCEDSEELYADGIAMAAHMLEGLERRGKQVTPGNIVFYTALHLRSGRRSYSTGRTDVMGSATQIGKNTWCSRWRRRWGLMKNEEPMRLEEMLDRCTGGPINGSRSQPGLGMVHR